MNRLLSMQMPSEYFMCGLFYDMLNSMTNSMMIFNDFSQEKNGHPWSWYVKAAVQLSVCSMIIEDIMVYKDSSWTQAGGNLVRSWTEWRKQKVPNLAFRCRGSILLHLRSSVQPQSSLSTASVQPQSL